MYLLYDLILLVSAFFLIPYYLLRGLKHGKVRRGIRERFGFYAPGRLEPLRGKRVFWVHAVSVGETRAAIPLVKALRAAYPDCALVLSNVTETGHAIANGIAEVDLCLFFPFDMSWGVKRVLRQIRPELVVIVETEIWPNFVRQARMMGIPLMLVNGRISDRSFPRYQKAGFVFRPLLQMFDRLCMQTEQDAERIRQLGAPEDRVVVTRNLKFDMDAVALKNASVDTLKSDLCLSGEGLIWVAGSTHAGEEEAVIAAYRQLLGEGVDIRLILVPRHPERCRVVQELLSKNEIPCTLRSDLGGLDRSLEGGEVLLVDSVGEMLKFYAVSDIVFVGGSLVPVGGHNILEASLMKKAVIFGSHMHNFKEISRLLLQAGGGVKVEDGVALTEAVRSLCQDRDLRIRMGENGNALLSQNAGATAHTLGAIAEVAGQG